MTRIAAFLCALLIAALAQPVQAEVERRTLNDGNLILEDIPAIPQTIVDDLNRYQNVRSASFLDWTADGESLYVSTRFGEVEQIHRVDMPGGARHQLTFFDEPVSQVSRQPEGSHLIFAMDAGGNEFSQLFLFDPLVSRSRMISDGESRNGGVVWTRDGERIAFQSTRRNGASNDVWMMPLDQALDQADSEPEAARLVLAAPDGTWWGPADFDEAGERLLILNYVSITDSRIHLLDLDSGETTLLAGGDDDPSSNWALGFDHAGEGYWFITDRGGEFKQLAWQPLEPGAEPVIVTADIPWDVEGMAFSKDRRRAVFAVNEDGLSRLYLLDPASRRYRAVSGLPTGLVGGLGFSPDGSRLAMTLNTPQTPSDTFVLELGEDPLAHGVLTRWTHSEVGGLDTDTFVEPELVRFESFDGLSVPAWVYKPEGDGPFPVVVSIHGGPESQARPAFSSTYQMWLAKLGVAVVVPNVRGSAGYGKSYLAMDNAYKREDSVRDIGALLEWIGTRPDLDADRVAVFGGSYGGYMVLASAVHYSDRLKAAVDIVGISSFVTFLENTEDYRRDLRRVEYGDERDPEMRAHLEKISPLNNVEKIAVPMLVVQGENDPRVPVTEAEQIVEALREKGETVWYMNALNEGHGYRRKENRDVYQQAVVLFFRRHLLDQD
ncbi:S9 family peptidase [Lentisalinibacter orientalis]|uniref:S9 family peptidase n=1 Tax=Lentisalinibacter orientalis TaxID=2992241 RepID=UPI00386DF730